jgi:hypothetical protein
MLAVGIVLSGNNEHLSPSSPSLSLFVFMFEVWWQSNTMNLTAFKAFLDLASGKVPMHGWADLICLLTYTISV